MAPHARIPTLDDAGVAGRTVLARVDINVPMDGDQVADDTRIRAVAPTITELADKDARIVLLAHFGRPKGKTVPEMSLAPIAPVIANITGRPVAFAEDCVGPIAEAAIAALGEGQVLLLENTRFHAGEEANDADFAKMLAALGDLFVNDAFAAAHRAHASTAGIADHLPSYAGRLMQAELDALEAALTNPTRPVMAIVGGAKISTKLDILGNLGPKVDFLAIGGAMANTFLAANGHPIGKSLSEPDLVDEAISIIAAASGGGAQLLLPVDVVVAKEFEAGAPSRQCGLDEVGDDEMILDIGPKTIETVIGKLETCRTLVWNGPFGAFEIAPFDAGTRAVAKKAAALTGTGRLVSVAGGGDTIAALNTADAASAFTYASTAGGAFLEWLEGRDLPGVEALREKT